MILISLYALPTLATAQLAKFELNCCNSRIHEELFLRTLKLERRITYDTVVYGSYLPAGVWKILFFENCTKIKFKKKTGSDYESEIRYSFI